MTAASEADITKNADSVPVEGSPARVNDLGVRLRDVSRTAVLTALDVYDTAVDDVLDGQQNLVDLTQIQWVSTLARVNLSLVRDLKASQVRMARELLS